MSTKRLDGLIATISNPVLDLAMKFQAIADALEHLSRPIETYRVVDGELRRVVPGSFPPAAPPSSPSEETQCTHSPCPTAPETSAKTNPPTTGASTAAERSGVPSGRAVAADTRTTATSAARAGTGGGLTASTREPSESGPPVPLPETLLNWLARTVREFGSEQDFQMAPPMDRDEWRIIEDDEKPGLLAALADAELEPSALHKGTNR